MLLPVCVAAAAARACCTCCLHPAMAIRGQHGGRKQISCVSILNTFITRHHLLVAQVSVIFKTLCLSGFINDICAFRHFSKKKKKERRTMRRGQPSLRSLILLTFHFNVEQLCLQHDGTHNASSSSSISLHQHILTIVHLRNSCRGGRVSVTLHLLHHLLCAHVIAEQEYLHVLFFYLFK